MEDGRCVRVGLAHPLFVKDALNGERNRSKEINVEDFIRWTDMKERDRMRG
jgi:hypothetical protein